MTNSQLKTWRQTLGWTQAYAATQLGVSLSSYILYERGSRYDSLRKAIIPRTVKLACLWLFLPAEAAETRDQVERLVRLL